MIYRSFVERGQYLVAEDTNINGHPVFKWYGRGPFEAVNVFLKKTRSSSVTTSCGVGNCFRSIRTAG